MATISSLGSGSGLDLEGILTKLMSIEQAPLTALSTKQTGLQSQISAFGALQGTLSALQITAQTLKTPTTFGGVSASYTDASVLTATGSAGATPGNYLIKVSQLAQAQTLRSNTNYATVTDTFNTGSLAINVGSATPVTVTINSSNNTLSGIRDAINGANAGVTASIVNDGTTNRLLLSSNTTGLTAGAITVTATDSGTGGTNVLTGLNNAGMTQTQAPLDAILSVNGLDITRTSNTITDAINKTSFTLNKAGSIGSPVTTLLTLSKDTSSVQTAVTNFVSAYNSVVKQIQTLSSYDATNGTAAILTGDATLRNIRSQLSSTIFGTVSGLAGGIKSLSDIGVSIQKDGTLAADSTKLQAALSDPSKDVVGLITSTTADNTGIAVRLYSLMGTLVGTGGIIASRTDGLNRSIKDIGTQQTALSLRLTKIEANYRARFTALDTTIASMQGTSTYMTQQLNYLQSIATGVSGTTSSTKVG